MTFLHSTSPTLQQGHLPVEVVELLVAWLFARPHPFQVGMGGGVVCLIHRLYIHHDHPHSSLNPPIPPYQIATQFKTHNTQRHHSPPARC